jgi:hypothetical protein
VRQGAQLELAKRNQKDALLAVARDMNVTHFARIHALWGYGQLLRKNVAEVSAVAPLLRDADAEIRAQTAKIFGDAATTGAKNEGRALVPLLTDASARTRLQAAIALGKYREPAAVDALFALAAKEGADPGMRHAAVTGLTGCATAAQLGAKKTDPAVNVRLAAVIALRRQASPAIGEFLRDADVLVVAEAARGVHDDAGIADALPALAALLDGGHGSEVITRRAINAGLRVGTPEAAQRLLTFALNASAPRAMREAALDTLRQWKTPPRLDLVDGYARALNPARIDRVLTPKLDALLALTDPGLKTLAIEIMIAHALKARPEQIGSWLAKSVLILRSNRRCRLV